MRSRLQFPKRIQGGRLKVATVAAVEEEEEPTITKAEVERVKSKVQASVRSRLRFSSRKVETQLTDTEESVEEDEKRQPSSVLRRIQIAGSKATENEDELDKVPAIRLLKPPSARLVEDDQGDVNAPIKLRRIQLPGAEREETKEAVEQVEEVVISDLKKVEEKVTRPQLLKRINISSGQRDDKRRIQLLRINKPEGNSFN